MSTPSDSTVQPARTPRGTLRRLRRAALRNEALGISVHDLLPPRAVGVRS